MIAHDRTANLRVSIAILLTCFVLGAAISRPVFSAWRSALQTQEPGATLSVALSISYETYLMLGLDEFSNQQPKVEAVWLVTVPLNDSTVELIGLHPEPFRDQYSPALGGLPLLTIQPHLRGPLAGTVIFDRDDLVELADRLGGVTLLGAHTDGAGLLNFIAAADPNNPDDLLLRQSAVMQSLVAQGAISGVKVDLTALIQVPSRSNVEREKEFDLIRRYYPLNTEAVRIHPLVDDVAGASP